MAQHLFDNTQPTLFFTKSIHSTILHTVTLLYILAFSHPLFPSHRACVAHLDSPEGMTRGVRETADSIGASSGGRVDVSGF